MCKNHTVHSSPWLHRKSEADKFKNVFFILFIAKLSREKIHWGCVMLFKNGCEVTALERNQPKNLWTNHSFDLVVNLSHNFSGGWTSLEQWHMNMNRINLSIKCRDIINHIIESWVYWNVRIKLSRHREILVFPILCIFNFTALFMRKSPEKKQLYSTFNVQSLLITHQPLCRLITVGCLASVVPERRGMLNEIKPLSPQPEGNHWC